MLNQRLLNLGKEIIFLSNLALPTKRASPATLQNILLEIEQRQEVRHPGEEKDDKISPALDHHRSETQQRQTAKIS